MGEEQKGEDRVQKTTVVNIHSGADYDVYMGRPGRGVPGPFGSPFGRKLFLRGEVRDEIIRKHADWFHQQVSIDLAFLGRVLALRGKRLGCFCAPKPCHADVIAKFVNHVEEAAISKPTDALGWDACPVCTVLMWAQISARNTCCPDCGRWFCPTHKPKEVHACPSR